MINIDKKTLNKINLQLKQVSKSKFYKEKYSKQPYVDSYRSFSELEFTTKDDLRKSYPFGTLSTNSEKVIETHMSSGTTGKPTLSLYTKKDIELSTKALAKAWKNFGVNKKSGVQFMMSYGLFSGAPLNTYAIQSLGAFVLPSGIQSTSKQIQLMQDFKIDTIVATPSYLLHLIDYIKDNDIDWKKFNVKTAIAAGEVYSDSIKQKISKALNIKLFDHYGLCEVNTGIIYECKECSQMATLNTHIFTEVINTETNEHVKIGEIGELALTSLEKEATPIIRYKTGDLVVYLGISKKCKLCYGSTHVSRIKNRTTGTIFYKGIKLEPHELRDDIFQSFGNSIYHRIKIIIPKDLFKETPVIKLSALKADKELKNNIEKFITNKFKVKFLVEIVDNNFFNDFLNTKESIVEYAK